MKGYIKYLVFASALLLLLSACRPLEGDTPEITKDAHINSEEHYPSPDGKKVVYLDAGHGFRDIGCDTDLINGTEADINIAVVKLLKTKLEERGVEVILTHDGASFPSASEIKKLADKNGIEYKNEDIVDNDIFSAYERAIYISAIAEEVNIDLFVSLHVNSIENHPEISRYEINFCKDNLYSSALIKLCEDLAESLDKETKISADPYADSFIVTKPKTYPSLLFEMGYATNEKDAADLNSDKWREDFTSALAENVVDWIASYEEK